MNQYFTTPLTPEAIARGLSTVPRWTARTILDRVGLRWSVLQHSLACVATYQQLDPQPDPLEKLTILLHDAEEVATGDIPSPYKTAEQSALGDKIRWEIFRGLGLPEPSESKWARVKGVDDAVGLAERWVLLHPAENIGDAYPDPNMIALDQVWGLLDIDPRSAIEMYTELVYELLEIPSIKTLAGRV